MLVSDFRKTFAGQLSKKQLHPRRFQSKVRKTRKLVQNFKSVTTSTFESKFVLGMGFIVKTSGCPVLV